MQRNYKKAVVGTNTQSAAMIFKTDAPLDDRTAVRCKGALISQTALGKNNTSDKGWLFNGLIVCDLETGDLYTLYNKAAITLYSDSALDAMSEEQIDAAIARGWRKMATKADIEGLSGLWKFKGVAESISPDKDTIFVRNLHISDGSNVSYKCAGFEYDIAFNKYFKWVNDTDSVYSKEEDDEKLYRKLEIESDDSSDSSDSDDDYLVLYVQDPDGNLYFKTSDSSGKEWERLSDGQKVYTAIPYTEEATNVSFYLSSTATGTPLLTADIESYVGSIFESIGDTSFYELPEAVTASSENNGQVYQIEDKEYASNGLIWVELGSPKEDLNWLVIS